MQEANVRKICKEISRGKKAVRECYFVGTQAWDMASLLGSGYYYQNCHLYL